MKTMRNVACAASLLVLAAASAAAAPASTPATGGAQADPSKAGQNVNHNSTRSNRSPQDGDGIAAPGASVSVELKAKANGGYGGTQGANAGAASFANVPPGEYSLTISPADTPTHQITGAELSTNALISCNPSASGNKRVCPDVTVNGKGPQTVTVKLLGKPKPASTEKMKPPGAGSQKPTTKKPGGG